MPFSRAKSAKKCAKKWRKRPKNGSKMAQNSKNFADFYSQTTSFVISFQNLPAISSKNGQK
jgi:hypothetical protein